MEYVFIRGEGKQYFRRENIRYKRKVQRYIKWRKARAYKRRYKDVGIKTACKEKYIFMVLLKRYKGEFWVKVVNFTHGLMRG